MRPATLIGLCLLVCLALGTATAQRGARAGASPAFRTDSLRISEEALRFDVSIGYPVLQGVPGAVNAAIRDSVVALAEAFRPREAVPRDAPAHEATWVRGGTEVGLVRPTLVSAITGVYAYTGGAHGTTVFRSVNVNPRTGARVAFGDVVRDGRALRDTLAAHVTRVVVDRLVTAFGESPAEARRSVEGYNRGRIRLNRPLTFAFVPDSLVLYLPPYEVMPYAVGPFRVPVALRDLRPFLQPDGPAAAAMTRR